jgi:penicillin-binding protein 2
VLSVSRDYPLSENYTHVLGYVSMASEKDIINNEVIKNNHVPGLKGRQNRFRKIF